MLGNTVPHLHTHIVPRYVTDDSPGQPAKGLMQPDPHRTPVADAVFHRDVAGLRVALSRSKTTERQAHAVDRFGARHAPPASPARSFAPATPRREVGCF